METTSEIRAVVSFPFPIAAAFLLPQSGWWWSNDVIVHHIYRFRIFRYGAKMRVTACSHLGIYI